MSTEAPAVHAPWHRQPWVWFVIGLPLVSVVASLSLVAISVIHKDDLVRDDWYKAGRAINHDVQADRRAVALGLSGRLVLEPATPSVSIELAAAGTTTLPDRLMLSLVHSTMADEDMTALLTRGSDGFWHGTLPRLPLGKRHLALEPAAATADNPRWRLRAGDVIFQGEPVTLRPAF
ncbi:MAG: FixH family protein [Pseudomonadota bacterium]